jgi:hypothetical protein
LRSALRGTCDARAAPRRGTHPAMRRAMNATLVRLRWLLLLLPVFSISSALVACGSEETLDSTDSSITGPRNGGGYDGYGYGAYGRGGYGYGYYGGR